jgi:hypothetical protein
VRLHHKLQFDFGQALTRTTKFGIAILAMMAMLVPAASASVVGTLATGSGGSIIVSLTFVRFSSDPSSNPAGPPWNAEVSNATSLMFAGCPSGTLGLAGCLDAAPNSPNEAVEINQNTDLTASTVLPENNFLTFAGNGTTHATIDYTLTQVLAGSSNTNCAGLAQFESCSVFVGSPIVLTLEGTGTTATLNLAGTVTDGVGPIANWAGKFSATFPNQTPEQLLLALCPSGTCGPADFSRGTTLTTSNSGTFASSTVPEPSYTTILIGGGLISLASLIRKRKRNVVL